MNSAPTILMAPSTQKAGEEFYDYAISLSDAYTRAVVEAGGIPFVTPCAPGGKLVAEMVARVDGILLSGGGGILTKVFLGGVSGGPPPKTTHPRSPGGFFLNRLR